jgi:hypothetical protein
MEVSDLVPHRTTYGQNNSWVVHEIPTEWLPVRCETNRPAGAIGRDCRACARITGLTSAASPRVYISSTCKVGQKLGVSVPLLICCPSVWPSRLLYRRGLKSQRDLWITLYLYNGNAVQHCCKGRRLYKRKTLLKNILYEAFRFVILNYKIYFIIIKL